MIVFGFVLLEVLSYFLSTFVFVSFSVLTGISLLSFVVPTQVVQQNLEFDDTNIAVMMTYLDFLCPIQNIMRITIQ